MIPVLLILTLMPGVCVAAPPDFDEEKWARTVKHQDAEAVYAPNQKNGVFFNPWKSQFVTSNF